MSPEQTSALANAAPAIAPGHAGKEVAAPDRICANCGAAVSTRFCGACGQRAEHAPLSVLHFVQEATEDLTHTDSRLWRTLAALLFRPGLLTAEFFAGKRVCYLPPVRLYLVLSLLFFLIAASSGHEPQAIAYSSDRHIPTHTGPLSELPTLRSQPGETPQQREARVCEADYDGPAQRYIQPLLLKGCRSVLADNGRSLMQSFLHNVPRAMFLFLPVLALFMTLLYWHPRRYYVEHLLFLVHNHAFVFLLFSLLWLLELLLPGSLAKPLTDIAWFYVPCYLFLAMRRVYGQSRIRTAMKMVAMFLAYGVGAGTMVVATSLYSLMTL